MAPPCHADQWERPTRRRAGAARRLPEPARGCTRAPLALSGRSRPWRTPRGGDNSAVSEVRQAWAAGCCGWPSGAGLNRRERSLVERVPARCVRPGVLVVSGAGPRTAGVRGAAVVRGGLRKSVGWPWSSRITQFCTFAFSLVGPNLT